MDDLSDRIAGLLKEWQTEPHGDVRLNAERIAAKVVAEVVTPMVENLTRSRRAAEEVAGEMGDEQGAYHDALADALGVDRRRSWETLIEIAAGVTPELERQRAELTDLRAHRGTLMEALEAENNLRVRAEVERDEFKAAIERVRNLHQPMTRGGIEICAHCSGWNGFRCRGVVQPMPCPTLADLAASETPDNA